LRLSSTVKIVQGSIGGYIISYEWSEIENGLDLNGRLSIVNSGQLVLPSNTMNNGRSYLYRLIVSLIPINGNGNGNGNNGNVIIKSEAEYEIRTSLLPTSLLLQPLIISPSKNGFGISLSTLFHISLNGFIGELEPFKYSFKLISPSSSSASLSSASSSFDEKIIGNMSIYYFNLFSPSCSFLLLLLLLSLHIDR
jgi:hypothetical protein